MRLDFNVLWVEDQPDRVKAQADKIRRKIRAEGFKLETKFATSVDEAKPLLGSGIYGDHIDLILMDYDLGAGTKGDQGLIEVRRVFEYKDLIFYSAHTDKLAEIAAKTGAQGVFYSTREDLPDTAIGVFEALVKKVLDIDHSRGIVMGASSDIDHFVNQCLELSFDQGDGNHKSAALKLVTKRIEQIRERFNESASAIEKIKHVADLGDHHNVYTSVDRLNLLRAMLKSSAEHLDECNAMKEYATTTVPERNKLAHVRVIKNGFSRKLFDKEGKEITAAQMRQLRVDLLNHHERFENLEQKFIAKSGSEKKA